MPEFVLPNAAPLGLDYEWPEGVWTWRYPSGVFETMWLGPEAWGCAFASAKDAMSHVRRNDDWQTAKGEEWTEGWPEQTDLDCLLRRCRLTLGILLIDGSGNEIARRYAR